MIMQYIDEKADKSDYVFGQQSSSQDDAVRDELALYRQSL